MCCTFIQYHRVHGLDWLIIPGVVKFQNKGFEIKSTVIQKVPKQISLHLKGIANKRFVAFDLFKKKFQAALVWSSTYNYA